MRLDKYLKVSRVIKRRTVAKEICDAGRIMVNGHVAKAGHELKIGDILDIAMGSRRFYAMEDKIIADEKDLTEMSLAEMDAYWDKIKDEEK